MVTSRNGPRRRALKRADPRSTAAALFVLLAIAPSGPLQAQDWEPPETRPTAEEILHEMWSVQAEQRHDVHGYMIRNDGLLRNLNEAEVALFDDPRGQTRTLERVDCKMPSGEKTTVFREVPAEEYEGRAGETLVPTEEGLRRSARKMEAAGVLFNESLEKAGVPVTLLSMLNPEPMVGTDEMGGKTRVRYFNILNPGSYFTGYAIFFDAMAEAAHAARSAAERQRNACVRQERSREALMKNMANVGHKRVNDRPAWQLEANVDYTVQLAAAPEIGSPAAGLAMRPWQSTPANELSAPVAMVLPRPTANPLNLSVARHPTARLSDEFSFKKLTLWIDVERYAPLMTRIEGVMTQDGESTLVTLEKEETDYRQVPGTDMYESYRQIVRIFGFTNLGPEMEEAQRELQKVEAQLAGLSPNERAMVERTMGDKIKTMRNMAAGGPIVVEIKVEEIAVIPPIPGGAGSSPTNPIVIDCLPGSGDCPDEGSAEGIDGEATDASGRADGAGT